MDDLISRQAVIDAVHEEFDECTVWDESGEYTADVVERILDDVPAAQPGWIPCSERPPKVREWVLCQCRAGIMDVLRLTEDGNWYKNYPHAEYMSGFVIAWMPLPKPWEEDGHETD